MIERVQKIESFAGKKFIEHDFSGMKLQHADFKLATLKECNFQNADLKYADFTGANCYGSDFTGTSLYRANMRDCCLENTIFKPRDVFGLTITLKCETFSGMEIDESWLKAWMFFPELMKLPPVKNPDSDVTWERPWSDRIVRILGPDTFRKFKEVFNRRVL